MNEEPLKHVGTGLDATYKLMERVKGGEDVHYVGPTSDHPPPSFCVAMYCHEGYMLILRLGDETYV